MELTFMLPWEDQVKRVESAVKAINNCGRVNTEVDLIVYFKRHSSRQSWGMSCDTLRAK